MPGQPVLALAAGADTYKLPYGHRGVNQPVQDLLTRRCYMTSQNHGYAVIDESLPKDWEPWFVNVNDGTNEGIRSRPRPHFSIQFHPEASPGPEDTEFLFDDFIRLVESWRRAENVWRSSSEKAASSDGARFRSAPDRTSWRVRLLRLPGPQGAAGGTDRHGAGEPEHRDHPDESGAGRPHLPCCRDPGLRRENIVKENVDAILLSFGGQTALNCGLALHDAGVFSKYGIRVLGTPIDAIRDTEDRHLFVERLAEIGVKTARSRACHTLDEARAAIREIGLPVMLRGGYALGGKGSGIVRVEAEIDAALRRAFSGGVTQVLVEECLEGWKEIEYEVVRDARDNCVTVCNMENFDPMGIHTGDSIVVAPSQTLNDAEYQLLRSVAIRTIRHLGIVGECNIQYALDPKSADYRVIEVNARLSRSSALASKATGYPLAYVAAKLALGYALTEIPNGITRRTTAFFEPALDYLVCKFPRWDLGKFYGASTRIGSEMKSVGEVMAIGRTFAEVIQKAVRMLDIGVRGLDPGAFQFDDLRDQLRNATPLRIFAIAQSIRDGIGIDEIHDLTRIDRWFLHAIEPIVEMYGRLARSTLPLSADLLRDVKRLGFSDQAVGKLTGADAETVRAARKAHGIESRFVQIDTMAGEFPADTNYLYATYHADGFDVAPSRHKKVLILGSGTYRIGSSVEFDWCAVNAAQAASALGYETIMLNYNPETVSTDYDICDRLYFDEISLETVLDLYEYERPDGVVVSMGGQVPNNLAMRLAKAGVRVLGTSAESIDKAEDRAKFSSLLDELKIDQPRWSHVIHAAQADRTVEQSGGFPVLVRPSYVLSGAAMAIAHEPMSCAASWHGPRWFLPVPRRHLQIRDPRARSRDRRRGRPGRAGAVGHLPGTSRMPACTAGTPPWCCRPRRSTSRPFDASGRSR